MRLKRIQIHVIFHNFKGYDSHVVVRSLSEERAKRVNVVPDTTSEKYKMVSFGGYRYINSMSFLNASLDVLSRNLIKDELDEVPRFMEHFGYLLDKDVDLKLFTRKGVFRYEWFDSPAKLAHPELPTPEDFYNELMGSGLSLIHI